MMMLNFVFAAAVAVDFAQEVGKTRPELHGSGFGPMICSCPQESIDAIRSMGFKAARTHDWALINPNERVCDNHHIFPLTHLDPKDPKSYHFAPTDYLLKRTREETGLDVFFRLGTSIEHSGDKVHFNTLIPDDFDRVAENFAATVRHYNRGWADGFEWGIRHWEIWNEPDGHNNMWCLPDGDGTRGTPECEEKTKIRRAKFVKFFVTCLKRLKDEFGDTISVGGPAMCSMSTAYFRDLLVACKAAGVAPDFISWHHYAADPEVLFGAIRTGRKLCDELGFPDCGLIINEWHYFGPYDWSDLRSPDPEKRAKVWTGPSAHNGIDSSCFNLAVLSGFQTSALTQGYYYGCRHSGAWGFMDEDRRPYKVYHGLKLFGGLMRDYTTLCEAKGEGAVSALAVKSADGAKRALLVVDYRGQGREKRAVLGKFPGNRRDIAVDVKGVPAGTKVSAKVHDFTHDCEPCAVRFEDGRLTLTKADANSAAFLVTFE